jgi:hypothetical protein
MPKTILILSSNPMDSERLRLDAEIRGIDSGLQRSKKRNGFVLKQVLAARASDVRRSMLDFEPNIVHFCGHGGEEKGIAFEDNDGKINLVDSDVLAEFFRLFSDKVECVVLNACYSEIQARAIAEHISYVIGMKNSIEYSAAIEFAVAFYDAIGAGKSYEFAFDLACNAIKWKIQQGDLLPILKVKKQAEKKSDSNFDSGEDLESFVEKLPLSWIENYMLSLEILAKDLRLIQDNNFEFISAIDFVDIFEYCYPFIKYPSKYYTDSELESLLERQLSRYLLFYKFKNFYSYPVLLLPPYLAESLDSLKYFDSKIIQYNDNFNREFIESIIEKYKDEDKDIISNNVISLINQKSPELAFILGPSLGEGLSIYRELMSDVVKPSTEHIIDYLNLMFYISEMENSAINDMINVIRADPKKQLQNRRDAKAIQYVLELNKGLIDGNKILILISSSPHFNKFKKYFGNVLNVRIKNGEEICVLRNTDFLYTALIELGETLGCQRGKIDWKQIGPKDLLEIVKKDLNIVRKFNKAYQAANALGLSGTLKDDYVNDSVDIILFKEIIDRKKKLNVMELINDFLDEGIGMKHLRRLDIRTENLKTLNEINNTIKSKKYFDYVDSKRMEIEMEIKNLEDILQRWSIESAAK